MNPKSIDVEPGYVYIDENEQIRGSLYGFFVGDALGVPVEFVGRTSLKNNPIKDMEEYGTHNQPKGTWSDDSSMVLATIDSMYNNKEIFLQNEIFNYDDLMNRYSMWKNQAEYTPNQKVFDIGITTSDAISKYETNKSNVFCGSDSFNANGNGSLMRIIPLALYTKWCISEGYTIKLLNDNYDVIKKFSSLTHAHTLSIMSCYIYNFFVSNYIVLRDLNKTYIKTQKHFQDIFDGKIQKDYGDLELCKKYFDRLIYKDISKLKEDDIKSSGFVVDSLEASIWCVMTSNSFEESVLKAVNLGDDTDTIGALTGALAGLVYGSIGIPKKWIDSLQRKEYLDDMINKYIELIQLRIKKNEDDWQKSKDEYFERERQSKFQRVTKGDWNIKPMTNNTKELKVDIKLTDKELEYIKLGHKPLEMEDHFFMYYDDNDNSINYYRSWTGIQVYKAYYNENTKSIDRLVAHLVNEVYHSRITDEDLIKTFTNLINYDIESRKELSK